MSKKCELTGKNPMKGHNVSHANNKTKRRFLPNLKKVKFTSELLKRSLKLTVSNAGEINLNNFQNAASLFIPSTVKVNSTNNPVLNQSGVSSVTPEDDTHNSGGSS